MLQVCSLTNNNNNCNSIFLSYFIVSSIEFEEFLPFFDLDGIPNLKELPRTSESHSGPIYIPGPSASLLYGDEFIQRIYVSQLLIITTAWLMLTDIEMCSN